MGSGHAGPVAEEGSCAAGHRCSGGLGKELTLVNQHTVGPYTESNSSSTAGAGEIMVGRAHYGDENGNTYYQYATLVDD